MAKTVSLIVVVAALLLAFTASSGFGQKMMKSDMCDLYIADIRATWPPLHITVAECMDMLREALPNLKEGVDIQCKCVGGTSAS